MEKLDDDLYYPFWKVCYKLGKLSFLHMYRGHRKFHAEFCVTSQISHKQNEAKTQACVNIQGMLLFK